MSPVPVQDDLTIDSRLRLGPSGKFPGKFSVPAVSRKLNVVAGGLSIMQPNNGSAPGPIQSLSPAGVLNWANYLLGAKLNLYDTGAKVYGIAGAQSGPTTPGATDGVSNASLLTRYLNPSDSLAYMFDSSLDPDVLMLQFDSGDDTNPPGMSYAQSLSNIEGLYAAFKARFPDVPMWGTTLPGVNLTGNDARRLAVNPTLRSLMQSYGARLFDVEQIFTDRSTGLPLAGKSIDTIHQNADGALFQARPLAREWAPLVVGGSLLVPDPVNDSRCSVANGGWASKALLAAGSTGEFWLNGSSPVFDATNVADGALVKGPAGTIRYLLPRSDGGGGYWQRVGLPQGLAAADTISVQIATGVALAAGTQFHVECEVRHHGNFNQVSSFGFNFTTGNAGCFGYLLQNYGSYANYSDPGAGVVGTMISPTVTVPTGGITTVQLVALLTGLAGSFDWGRPSVVIH